MNFSRYESSCLLSAHTSYCLNFLSILNLHFQIMHDLCMMVFLRPLYCTYIKAVLQDLLKSASSMYVLLNKFSIIYISQKNINNRQYGATTIAVGVVLISQNLQVLFLHWNLVMQQSIGISRNVSISGKVTNMNTLEGLKYGDNQGRIIIL